MRVAASLDVAGAANRIDRQADTRCRSLPCTRAGTRETKAACLYPVIKSQINTPSAQPGMG
jgi:hypothetical protein